MESVPQLALEISPVERRVLNAFFSALEESTLSELTVTKLAQRAGTSRKTFYTYFKGTDDVVDLKARIMARDLMVYELVSIPSLMESRGRKETFQNQVACFFSFFADNIQVMQALRRSDLLQRFLRSFWHEIDALSADPPSDAQGKYLRFFASGGFSSMIEAWLEEGAVRSPQEMVDVTESIVQSLSQHRPW